MSASGRRRAAVLAIVSADARSLGTSASEATASSEERFGPLVATHGGQVVRARRTDLAAEFATSIEAVRFAIACREESGRACTGHAIGIDRGDVERDGERIFGDAVNVAARLADGAAAGSVHVSSRVRDDVEDECEGIARFDSVGTTTIVNIDEPVHAYALRENTRTVTGSTWVRRVLLGAALVTSSLLLAVWLISPPWLVLLKELATSPSIDGPLPLPESPSIVVLPFDNLTGEPDRERFVDGLTEDLTTDLARQHNMFVIARNSAFYYKGKPFRIKDVGRELGVQYALEGSIQQVGDVLRANAQLIQAENELHLWSGRFDFTIEDTFSIQDRITESVLESIGHRVQAITTERSWRRVENITARDAYLKGVHLLGDHNWESNKAARKWLHRAIELEPEYARAYGILAMAYQIPPSMGWTFDPGFRENARRHAKRCAELEPKMFTCRTALANIAIRDGQPGEAVRQGELAVEYAPGFFVSHMTLGYALANDGQMLRSLSHMRKAGRLNPLGTGPIGALGIAALRSGREAVAIENFEQARSTQPDDLPSRVALASAYVEQGRVGEAQDIVREILGINARMTVERIPEVGVLRPLGEDALERLAKDLTKAGLPTS